MITKFKNVSLLKEKRNGAITWFLLHPGGARDQYFDYYVKHLTTTRKVSLKTKKGYCYAIARFIDYLIEVAELSKELYGTEECLTGSFLIAVIEKYPKVLACASYSEEQFIKAICKSLPISELIVSSQKIHIAALNRYLSLSEAYNIRMRELGVSGKLGIPSFSELDLFPNMNNRVELSTSERIEITQKSVLGGVISGGAILKRNVVLRPYYSQRSTGRVPEISMENDAFPLQHTAQLINKGFLSYRDKALFSLCLAIGPRIHEALSITLWDIDIENRRVYLVGPRGNRGPEFYYGYFSGEELRDLRWKGRSTKYTFMIEPFAEEFWKYLKLYLEHEYVMTNQHPFLWQILKGHRIGHPLLVTDERNVRRLMEDACKRIGIDLYSPHTLRHLYGFYCVNYLPSGRKKFGLSIGEVKKIMGHAKRETTEKYAKHDIEKIEMVNKIHNQILKGSKIGNWKELYIDVYSHKLECLRNDLLKDKVLGE